MNNHQSIIKDVESQKAIIDQEFKVKIKTLTSSV